MQVWKGLQNDASPWRGGTLVIGNFDGLHAGHRALIALAATKPGPHVLMTFDPHPVQVLHPERGLKRLFPREDLIERLPELGVDLLVILPFDEKLARTPAERFWRECVWEPFRPRHVIAGHDFAFGQSREGTLARLAEWARGEGSELTVLPQFEVGGEIVSSRGIRELVRAGEVERAREKLGRPFYLRGRVGAGAGRGKGLGSPTLNLEVAGETLPPHGVYATLARPLASPGGERLPSVTNVGINPTFHEGSGEGLETKVETHVIGRVFEARGEWVDVDFIARLRPEMKFASIEDLKKQIQSDILKAKEIVARYEALDGGGKRG